MNIKEMDWDTTIAYGNEGGIELFNSKRNRRSVDRPEFFVSGEQIKRQQSIL